MKKGKKIRYCPKVPPIKKRKNWLLLSCLIIILLASAFLFLALAGTGAYLYFKNQPDKTTSGVNLGNFINRLIKPTMTPFPTITPSPVPQPTIPLDPVIPTDTPIPEINIIQPDNNEPWGVASQIDEHTWTMKVGADERMGTAMEIFEALNHYRVRYGKNPLTWVPKLADYAQSRAAYLNQIQKNDGHEGFYNFLNNEDGYTKLGYRLLGENTCYGYKLFGVHLIEWIFAGDQPHNDNQLDSRWGFVGIGVEGLGVSLIFGAESI